MLVHLRSGVLAGARAHSLKGAAACVAPRLSRSSTFPHLTATRRYAGGSAAGTAPAEGEVVAELQKLLGSKQCVPVEEAAAQLNFGDADLKAAIKQLEASGEVFRYVRRGRFDVLVASPQKVILQALAKQSPEALVNELNELHSLLAAKRVELADLEKVKEACDEVARKHPDKFATLGMMGMTGLWCLLFWMVFAESMFGCETFAFDWNLVWRGELFRLRLLILLFFIVICQHKTQTHKHRSSLSHTSWGTAWCGSGLFSTTSQVCSECLSSPLLPLLQSPPPTAQAKSTPTTPSATCSSRTSVQSCTRTPTSTSHTSKVSARRSHKERRRRRS